MPRNISGIYTLPSGNPVVPGTTIDAEWANDTMEDLANEITNSLSRTGAGGMLAPFRLDDGTVTAPGLSFLNETNSGLYRSGSGSVWMSVLGVNTAQFSSLGLTIPSGKALAAQGNATVGGTLAVTGTLSSTGGVINTTVDSITNHVGADHVHFKVKATQALVKGDVVKVTGYNVGDEAFEVAKVSSASDIAIGIVYANISNGALGAIINTGLLSGLDTSAFTAGQILYPNTSGGLTATKPSSGQYQAIAYVLRSNSNNGAILIEASEPLYVQTASGTANTLVLRDGSGNFSAGTITANLTGNVTGNVSGNAGTVTNGVYTTGSYSNPSWITGLAGSKITGNISGNAANVTGTVAIGNGGTGATTAAAARTALDVPTRTGGDASGTWGISITGNAANVTGTVAVANGGTGATTASGARTNLGLAIGTDVPSPTGTGASGTWGISVTGNAGTVTNGVYTTGSYSDPSWITGLAGSKITGNISGNAANVTGTVAVVNGGTGATTASGARSSLLPSYSSNALKALRVNAGETDVEWFTVAAGGDVNGPASSTDNALVRFDGATGKLIQDSAVTLGDTGDLSGIAALSMSNNLTLTGTGARILGDFSNATIVDRLLLQTTATNSSTSVAAIPNGSSTTAALFAINNSTPTNASTAGMFALSGEVRFASGITGSGTYLPMTFYTDNTERMRIDTAGNVGINKTPAAWGTGYRAIQLNATAAINADAAAIVVSNNNYYDGTNFKYLTTAAATDYYQFAGTHTWRYAASGTAGNNITFTTGMVLDNSGNLGLGVTPSAWRSTYRGFDIGTAGLSSAGAISIANLSANAYFNQSSQWIYKISSDPASYYRQASGVHAWFTAPSGTAGNAITFTEVARIADNGARSTVVPSGSTLYPAFDCRAWVNFNGTGTVAIRASGNVTSITDNNVGDYTVNFTTAMPDANYCVLGMGVQAAGNAAFVVGKDNATAYTTSAARLSVTQGTTRVDGDTVNVSVFR